MKNNPLFSIIAESLDRMFIVDKQGKTIFFPWGGKRQGYYIKNKNVATKIKKLYRVSFYACFVLLIIALSFWGEFFWGIIGSMVICFGGWYFAYFLYVSKIVKSLPPVKASYKELILAKFETEDLDDKDTHPETQFPAHWSNPIPITTNDPLLGVKRIWYRLSPDQLFILYFFTGVGIILVWVNFNQNEFGESPVDYLIACFVCILWGLAGFVNAKNMEIEKRDWWNFLNWKLPMILMTIVFWVLAVISLYKFFVMIIA